MIYSGTKDGEDFGFYLENDNLQKITELTNDEHIALLKGQDSGKVIVWDKETGKPKLQDPPLPTKQELKVVKITEIKTRLAVIDIETTRPLRAITSGAGAEEDKTKLKQLETEAAALRNELRKLM